MKFFIFFLLFWVISALLDPDPDSEYGSGSTDLIESGSKDIFVICSGPNLSIRFIGKAKAFFQNI
jgi:hypothetical protein